MTRMIKLLFLFLPLFLYAKSPFESVNQKNFNLSAYETKKNEVNEQATKNVKVTCKFVCDKRVYKEQKISDAIEFYKKSNHYNFNKD